MNNYSKFKTEIGYSSKELEKATGYTRQGLHNAFGMISEGKKPSNQFIVCINAAINKKIQEEMKNYEEKISKLRKLQNEYTNMEG